MNWGPWWPWVAGFVGLFFAMAPIELGVIWLWGIVPRHQDRDVGDAL